SSGLLLRSQPDRAVRAVHSCPTRRSSDLPDVDEEVFVAREPATRSAPDRRTFLRLSAGVVTVLPLTALAGCGGRNTDPATIRVRSEEHTSELQSRFDLVCRLLLENANAAT